MFLIILHLGSNTTFRRNVVLPVSHIVSYYPLWRGICPEVEWQPRNSRMVAKMVIIQ
ncbi:MAG: hypothetical protein LBF88_04230 [Planctomycetaceae bacterium]|nr:hypothetical protein [Planctomycetaceae bacterium]